MINTSPHYLQVTIKIANSSTCWVSWRFSRVFSVVRVTSRSLTLERVQSFCAKRRVEIHVIPVTWPPWQYPSATPVSDSLVCIRRYAAYSWLCCQSISCSCKYLSLVENTHFLMCPLFAVWINLRPERYFGRAPLTRRLYRRNSGRRRMENHGRRLPEFGLSVCRRAGDDLYLIGRTNCGSLRVAMAMMIAIPLTAIGIMPGFWLLNLIMATSIGITPTRSILPRPPWSV